MHPRIRTLIVSCVLGFALLLPAAGQEPDVIHVGIVESLIKDLSPGKRKIIDSEFPDLVKDFTGFKSDVEQGGDAFAAAKKLADGKLHLAVLQGVEFSWVQAQDEKLKPLMLVVDRQKTLHALVVVKKDSSAASLEDLKGKELAVLDAKEHCRLFLDKNAGGAAKKFFGKATDGSSAEKMLDDVLRGKIAAAVVDNPSLETYKDINPGRFERLKVIAKSETFPTAVLVFREGGLSEKVQIRFREGMLKANQTDKGREAMANFRVTAFETVSPDYMKLVAEIRKTYPATRGIAETGTKRTRN